MKCGGIPVREGRSAISLIYKLGSTTQSDARDTGAMA